MKRYSRQVIFPPVGEDGQRRLGAATALVVGCGALGSCSAELLARAGVGRLRLVDRDYLEEHNLQRQSLYDERLLAADVPKAVAAAQRIGEINSHVSTEAHVTDVTAANVLDLFEGVDVVLDGTDNWQTRYLLNDAAVHTGTPWVYGGVLGTTGVSMLVEPGRTPCLRCIFPDPPPPGGETCETAGVLGPAVWSVGSVQAMAAMRLLLGDPSTAQLLTIDAWTPGMQSVHVGAPDPDCPACGLGDLVFLSDVRLSSARLCGRNAVQVSAPSGVRVDLRAVAERTAALGEVRYNEHLLRFKVDGCELTLFADGRAVVRGLEDPALARSLYARYIGA